MKKGSPKGEQDKAQKTRLVTLAACATTGAPKERSGYEHDKIMERDAEIRVKLGLYDGR